MATLPEEVCHEISERTAMFVQQGLLNLMHGAVIREARARVAAGETELPGHRLVTGAKCGAIAAIMQMDWGFLPESAKRQDLIDEMAATLPTLLDEVLTGPPGVILADLIERGMSNVKPKGRA